MLGVLLAGYSRHGSILGKHFARWSINESAEAFGAFRFAPAYILNDLRVHTHTMPLLVSPLRLLCPGLSFRFTHTTPRAFSAYHPTQTSTTRTRNMASTPNTINVHITPLEQSDYAEWERLFRLYIAFYESSLPDTQYAKTFARILDPQKDLYGLVLRDATDPKKLYGLAHYFPTQTPWAEEMLMHFNGKLHDADELFLGWVD